MAPAARSRTETKTAVNIDLIYVVLWVLPSVLVGVYVGHYLGRGGRGARERQAVREERESTLKSVAALLTSAEKLSSDVDSHSSEIAQVSRQVGDLKVSGEMEQVQRTLLRELQSVLVSNQRLEDDLVVARHRMEEQAQEIDRTRLEARTDALSGVANRKAFDERLSFMLTALRREGQSFVLLLADVDHFKWINDTHGHTAGDRVVAHVGEFLKSFVRTRDYVARYGGDEFAILLAPCDTLSAQPVAERIRAAIARKNFDAGLGEERVTVTFSMGYAAALAGDTPESIIARADRALYRSKEGGRNQVQGCQPGDEAEVAAELSAV